MNWAHGCAALAFSGWTRSGILAGLLLHFRKTSLSPSLVREGVGDRFAFLRVQRVSVDTLLALVTKLFITVTER